MKKSFITSGPGNQGKNHLPRLSLYITSLCVIFFFFFFFLCPFVSKTYDLVSPRNLRLHMVNTHRCMLEVNKPRLLSGVLYFRCRGRYAEEQQKHKHAAKQVEKCHIHYYNYGMQGI